jgi:hypothetical protein
MLWPLIISVHKSVWSNWSTGILITATVASIEFTLCSCYKLWNVDHYAGKSYIASYSSHSESWHTNAVGFYLCNWTQGLVFCWKCHRTTYTTTRNLPIVGCPLRTARGFVLDLVTLVWCRLLGQVRNARTGVRCWNVNKWLWNVEVNDMPKLVPVGPVQTSGNKR